MGQETRFYPLRGGLNLTSPAIEMPPGHVIAGLNYEPIERGYGRVAGYERFDGRPKPSEASYSILYFDNGVAEVAASSVVTGVTSGATGTAIRAGVLYRSDGGDVGSYAGSDAQGYLVLTSVSGTFVDNEALQVSGSGVATVNGEAVEAGAPSDDADRAWLQMSIERARAAITAPTGAGALLGGFVYQGDVYAFRNVAGNSAAKLWRATTAGWVEVPFGRALAFTLGGSGVGNLPITEGVEIVGATSSATATVLKVVVTSGDWDAGTAAGTIWFASQTGTFTDEDIRDGGVVVGHVAGNSTAVTLPPGGRYECVVANFYGASNLIKVYGVNGVGRAFEFDGTTLALINTGLPDDLDKPQHLAVHKGQLFLSYEGGLLQNSAQGDPFNWASVEGAVEIGLGESITGIVPDVQGALVALGRNKIAVLYGNNKTDFTLTDLSSDSGAAEWSVSMIDVPIYLDHGGVRSLQTSNAFGNFVRGSFTQMIEPLIRAIIRSGLQVAGCLVCKAKDQYRLYWSDGRGIVMFLGRKSPETLPVKLLHTPWSFFGGDDSLGRELLFMGSTSGMLYQLESGTSHDGSPIEAYLRFPFCHVGSPTQEKRWHKVTIEADSGPGIRIGITAEFAYGNADQPPGIQVDYVGRKSVSAIWGRSTWGKATWKAVDVGALEDQGVGGFYEEDFWDRIYWSSPIEGSINAYVDGIGNNMSVTVFNDGTYARSHVLHGIIFNFTYRRLRR